MESHGVLCRPVYNGCPQFSSKWIILSETHWDTEEAGEESGEEKGAERGEKEQSGEVVEEGRGKKKKVITKVKNRPESEIDYRRDMPNSKTEEVVRRVAEEVKQKEKEKSAEVAEEVSDVVEEVDSTIQVSTAQLP